jgi:hypothetical protein
MERIQDLLLDLEELIDERGEKEEFFDKATQDGEAEEADQIHTTIEEINAEIELIKHRIISEVESY